MVAEHFHADDRRAVFGYQQIIVREFFVVARDHQCTDPLSDTVDRNNRRVFAVKQTFLVLFIRAHARLRPTICKRAVDAIDPIDVLLRKFPAT